MLKLIGALMVICGAGSVGIRAACGYRSRVRVLNILTAAVESLRAELTNRALPLTELMEGLSLRTPEPVSVFFRRVCTGMERLGETEFAEIWRAALKASPELMLSGREEELLIGLGQTLGRYDTESQARSLSYVHEQLGSLARRAEREREEKSRLTAALSIAAGIAIVIILI